MPYPQTGVTKTTVDFMTNLVLQVRRDGRPRLGGLPLCCRHVLLLGFNRNRSQSVKQETFCDKLHSVWFIWDSLKGTVVPTFVLLGQEIMLVCGLVKVVLAC